MSLAGIGLVIVCKNGGGVGAIHLSDQPQNCGDCGAGLCWWTGEPGWCFVSKSFGERLCVKRNLGVGSQSRNLTTRDTSWKQFELPLMVKIMWIVPA